ncbi:hypothetical protein R3P38DRAFT_3260899 [Favolaschia claudopus]|uniref:Uncharacterized protein n=1 Tax=Favolaschia claudopus TaxID=2862362 RepID=A0AAW0CR80_9AGAR
MSRTLRDHNPRTSSSLPFPLSPCSNTVPFPLLHGAVPLEGSENLPPPRVRAQRVETQRRSQPPTPLEAFHTALQHVRMMSLRAQLSTAPSHEKHAVIDPYQDKPNIGSTAASSCPWQAVGSWQSLFTSARDISFTATDFPLL